MNCTFRRLCSVASIFGHKIRRCHNTKNAPPKCGSGVPDAHSDYDAQRLLKERILMGGPVTVAEYMKFCLSHPTVGYYMKNDVFGCRGDFTTSPEISQMFGELVGVWCLNEWLERGGGQPVQIVELGPGRGTLADDMLRAWSQFKQARGKVSLHLVEISDKMTELQIAKLCDGPAVETDHQTADTGHHRAGVTSHGVPVYWYRRLAQVPRGFSCFVAQEFFDALPVHKFQFTDGRWREVCVDYDPASASFKYILAKSPAQWSSLFIKEHLIAGRTHVEVCLESAAVAVTMAERVAGDGGGAIIADYGHNGDKSDTFRGFKNHRLHDPLTDPGSADLTADVDFSYLTDAVSHLVSTHGPVTQSSFLATMGITVRLKVLMQKADEKTRRDLVSGFRMLMDPAEMGERFKFFAMTPKTDRPYNPAGFTNDR